MPTTPGSAPLQYVGLEAEALHTAAEEANFDVDLIVHPSAKTVLLEMSKCEIVHLACHGVADRTLPSLSHLVMQRCIDAGTTKAHVVPDPLTLQQVFDTRLNRGKLAYLSACSTAQMGAALLADEALHLATGFLVAGFAHAIGCLWPAEDQICVQFAKSFYQHLVLQQKQTSSWDNFALAVHHATVETRAQALKQPLAWAPYVHFGS